MTPSQAALQGLTSAHEEVMAGDPTRGHWMAVHSEPTRLADVIIAHLRPALTAGGTALAILRREMHAPVLEGLEDVRAHGTLMLLESRATLDHIVRDGVDVDLFDSVVGARVRTGIDHGPLRAYGDMVDLLAEEGRVDDAASLESLWNDLRADGDFDLLCGYHAQRFMVHGGQARLFRLADLHDRLALPGQA